LRAIRTIPHASNPAKLEKTYVHNGTNMKANMDVDEPVAVPPQSKNQAR
jgi:hypothetical protein